LTYKMLMKLRNRVLSSIQNESIPQTQLMHKLIYIHRPKDYLNLKISKLSHNHHILIYFFLDIQYTLFYLTFREMIVRGKGLVGLSTLLHNIWTGRFNRIALFFYHPIKPGKICGKHSSQCWNKSRTSPRYVSI